MPDWYRNCVKGLQALRPGGRHRVVDVMLGAASLNDCTACWDSAGHMAHLLFAWDHAFAAL